MGIIYVDFSKTPHMLIGGATGSGKSVELKNILYQLKGKVMLYIVDFKGGLDYQEAMWHDESVEFMADLDNALKSLKEVKSLMDKRVNVLLEANAKNIWDYNKSHETKMLPVFWVCDEVAQLFNKSGLSKEDKEKVSQIEALLATIACIGRAFGVHLILATQRPDANVLSGQIKNNINVRLCGRADQVLSMIVLDNTDATKIRKDQPGRFIMHDGTEIQGFWMDKYEK